MAGVLTSNLVLQKTKLDDITRVRKLNCCGVQLHDIGVLKDAHNLEVLSLSVNDIDELGALANCRRLREVYLRRNSIKDVNQVLHLSRLRELDNLTMSENPIARDPNYRRFCIAAIPSLTRLDDRDILPQERAEAERLFPGLHSIPPPASPYVDGVPVTPHRAPAKPASAQPPSYAEEQRRQTAGGRPNSGANNNFYERSATAPRTPGGRSLERRFNELAEDFNNFPTNGHGRHARGAGNGNSPYDQQQYEYGQPLRQRPAPQPRPTSSNSPQSSHRHSGGAAAPHEESVVSAIKMLLMELSPSSLEEVRSFAAAIR